MQIWNLPMMKVIRSAGISRWARAQEAAPSALWPVTPAAPVEGALAGGGGPGSATPDPGQAAPVACAPGAGRGVWGAGASLGRWGARSAGSSDAVRQRCALLHP